MGAVNPARSPPRRRPQPHPDGELDADALRSFRSSVIVRLELERIAVVLGLAITAEVVGVVLAIAIWRARDRSLPAKLLWTFVALLPVLGVLAYVAWGDPPPPVGPTDRPTRRDWE